mmetsp:Transcript_13348/g.20227  ORF Transcript_13348/g.20227 Transcript_13348/m.20227 type:complete len:148 (-) Transcript_13348:1091-1534(-)
MSISCRSFVSASTSDTIVLLEYRCIPFSIVFDKFKTNLSSSFAKTLVFPTFTTKRTVIKKLSSLSVQTKDLFLHSIITNKCNISVIVERPPSLFSNFPQLLDSLPDIMGNHHYPTTNQRCNPNEMHGGNLDSLTMLSHHQLCIHPNR